jgi:hypothetical protein
LELLFLPFYGASALPSNQLNGARSTELTAMSPLAQAAGYLNNRTPKRKLDWNTPVEALTKKKPCLSHLHVYSCRAYPLDKDIPRQQKLEPRAFLDYLVGYDSTNVYRIWVPSHRKVIRTRDITFDETLFYDPSELDLGHALRQKNLQLLEELDSSDSASASLKTMSTVLLSLFLTLQVSSSIKIMIQTQKREKMALRHLLTLLRRF